MIINNSMNSQIMQGSFNSNLANDKSNSQTNKTNDKNSNSTNISVKDSYSQMI